MIRCPGQDQRFWKPEDIFEIECSNCGKLIEFFKDEPKLKCRHCNNIVINPKIDLGCAEWCNYAQQCLGNTVKNMTIIQNKIINEMKKIFNQNKNEIEHALSVLNYAEQIQATEGGDPLVIKAAAILHNIGNQKVEQKHDLSSGKHQEIEESSIVKEILSKYDIPEEAVEHVSKIISTLHNEENIDTIEYRCVWDSFWLVSIPNKFPGYSDEQIREIINKKLLTNKGREIALETFINNKC